jgi:hypothetical protein
MPLIERASLKLFNADELHELAEFALPFDLTYILGIMCRPNEPEMAMKLARGEVLDGRAWTMKLMHRASIPFQVDGATHVELMDHESPRVSLYEDLARAQIQGAAAGFILRWIVSRWQADLPKEATIAKASNVMRDWLQSSPHRRPATSSAVENWWRRYRSVAHLWAAWHLVDEASLDASAPDGFGAFAATSHWLLLVGSQIIPQRGSEPLLSVDTSWRLPDEVSGPHMIWSDSLDAHDIRLRPHPDKAAATGQK